MAYYTSDGKLRFVTPPKGRHKRQRRTRAQPVMAFVPRTLGPQVLETKYYDSYLNGDTIESGNDWTGKELDPLTTNTLFAPQEGNDVNNRVGRKVAVHRIMLRGIIGLTTEQDETDVLSNPIDRLILYIDQQTNATQSQAEDVMAAPGVGAAIICATTFQNTANFGRFRVLKDKIIRQRDITAATDGANTISQQACQIPFKFNIRFRKPVIVKFNGTNGGTVADIVDNSFHLIGIKGGGSTTHNIYYSCRTYYKDL